MLASVRSTFCPRRPATTWFDACLSHFCDDRLRVGSPGHRGRLAAVFIQRRSASLHASADRCGQFLRGVVARRARSARIAV